MSGQTTSHRAQCQNCGAPLIGPYCARCGQHDVDYHRSIRHMVEDFAEGFFHLDGKFFMSVRYLFTRPGFLTREFIAGRRAGYANPVRFYIFASFLFFVVAALTHRKPATPDTPEATARAGEALKQAEQGSPELKQIIDRNVAAKSARGTSSSAFVRRLIGPNGINDRELTAEIRHLLPTTLFFCLPFLALVLRAVFFHSGRYYIEHLIFALHLQAFVFLAELAREGITWCCKRISDGFGDKVETILLFGIIYLAYRSFRTVYGQSAWRTAFKFALTSGAYAVVLGVAMLATFLVSAMMVSNGT